MAKFMGKRKRSPTKTWRRKKIPAMARASVGKALRTVGRVQTYPFKRFVYKTTIGGTDGTVGYGQVNFSLNDVPNASELTQLFDQYRIAGIAYRWVINRNPDYGGAVVSNIYNTAVQGIYPRLIWVHDYDSNTPPATFGELQQYPRYRTFYFTPDKPATKWQFIRPARLAVEFESAVNSAYRTQWKGYIDCSSSTTPHYGILYANDGLNSNMQLRLECKYYLIMKNVR